jgi:hypothetical protein
MTHRKTENERQVDIGKVGKGVGEERNYTDARKLVPL